MDIKNKPTLEEKQAFWAEQLPNFEAKYWLPSHFELLEFDMEGGNYEVRDVLPEHYSEDDADDIYHRVNSGWAMWKKAINFTKAQAVPEPVLDAPARVGGGAFQKGVKWSTVIGAAQRHYENDGHHERPAISIADQLRVASGHSVVVPKEKLMQIIGSVSIIEPITRGNPYMDSIKRELTAITDVVKTVIEAQEPAPLKLGDLVEPIDHRYTLASGCERYPYAYVVNTNPFQLMSEEGDMYWCCTVEAGGYKLIKSNDQLPEAVSLRMIREGLLAPVETQEQSHE